MTSKRRISGDIYFESMPYYGGGYDYDDLEKAAYRFKPKLIIGVMLTQVMIMIIGSISDKGAMLMLMCGSYGSTEGIGLVHLTIVVVTTTTHKT